MTSRKFIGRPIATADNTDPPVILQKFNIDNRWALHAARANLIFYGDPAFTSLTMKLYADRGSAAKKLIATSTTTKTKLALMPVEDHGFREVGFEFDDIPLYPDTSYHMGIVIAGYTGTAASFICWASSWPNPAYQTGITLNQAKGAIMPLALTLIGSRL